MKNGMAHVKKQNLQLRSIIFNPGYLKLPVISKLMPRPKHFLQRNTVTCVLAQVSQILDILKTPVTQTKSESPRNVDNSQKRGKMPAIGLTFLLTNMFG